MEFQSGDNVVHCTHGLGQVLAIEERTFFDKITFYYMVQMKDLTIWIPADDNLKNRLRRPTSAAGFDKLLSVLSSRAEELPGDRRLRAAHLHERLEDGKAESVCKVIRDLTGYRKKHSWSESDGAVMRRAEKALISEWCFVHSITPLEAEKKLHHLLSGK
ncbi:MAG: CarD family transcriptional regulator [Anaerolineales bacterium]|nr:MAG: CarD family transcriptional regulator [Anaerolineales bacterium]